MDTQEEKDYKKLSFLKENRPIDRNQVNKLKASIQETGYWDECPIIVDKDMNIIDGQHRFTACQEMGIPIKYIVSKTMDINTLAVINTTQKNWNIGDFVNFYAHQDNVSYIMLQAFVKENKINPSIAIMLIKNAVSGGSDSAIIKSGNFTVTQKEIKDAQERATRILATVKLMRLPMTDKLVRALVSANKHPQFTFEKFLQKVSIQMDKIYRCQTTAGYLDMIEKIFNFKNSRKINLAR